MASRRMFSKDVVCSDRFLDMPASAQALYFQYGLEADDDGFVSAPKKILRLTNASDDDLKILVAKGFLIPFDSGVVVIRDWKINNYLRRDRYTPTRFKEEFEQLDTIDDRYQLHVLAVGIPDDNHVVDMRDTQVRLGKGYFEDTPKTRTSTRDIPLTAAITEHIEAQRKYWGFKVVRMDQYLFCNENGDPISRERIQGEIDRIIKRIKSDGYDFPRITSHVFRHTFATRAIEAGMPPQVLKTILGHSSLAMTMDLYSHVLPDTKADEMQKIANVF